MNSIHLLSYRALAASALPRICSGSRITPLRSPLDFNSLLKISARSVNDSCSLSPSGSHMYSEILKKGETDSYKTFNLDCSSMKVPDMKSDEFKEILSRICKEEGEKGIHVVSLKILSDQSTIMKCAIDIGFRHHQGNQEFSILNYCLKKHTVKTCTYPKYRTLSVGVTGVVFNKTLEKVLVVKEKHGPIKLKPPTGGVEYGKEQDTPWEAVVRELREETGIIVDPSKGVLVGHTWSNNFRGINPDISYIFAFVLQDEVKPVIQEDEISSADWVSIKDYLESPPEEKEKPWMLRQTVKTAWEALLDGSSWNRKTFYWTNGKPVELLSGFPHAEE